MTATELDQAGASAGDRDRGRCAHERGAILDSRFFADGYSTPASRRIFCDVCRMQRWLEVEAALALSEAEVGLIPESAAQHIATSARIELIDLQEVQDGVRRTNHSLVSLLSGLEKACPGSSGQFVHYGATTQDIQDTAQALEMREVLEHVERELRSLAAAAVELAEAHRETLMIGRTHARPALPTTFGLKAASWVDELGRHGERLAALAPRVLVAELHGGVGTMASFDGRGPALLERFARRLLLGTPPMGWHVSRDRVAEYLSTLAMLTATLARIADEIRTLGRPEFGEVSEGWRYGQVGSSTMPHKRNPETCEQVVVLARLVKGCAALGLDGMVQEHERDSRGLRLEWVAVADASHHTLAALAILGPLLAGLEVHEAHMASEAHEAAEQICSEALMLALGRRFGKQRAHALVYEVSQRAQGEGRSLREVLERRPDLTHQLDAGELDSIFDPRRYLGSAGELVDQVTACARRWLEAPPITAGTSVAPPEVAQEQHDDPEHSRSRSR
ncbi:MAG: adenylosuccinate lyase family protein [Actinomycetota bacterium]|nr:adenylosuccinate lyase family protein [Actinomycetota bacterium]